MEITFALAQIKSVQSDPEKNLELISKICAQPEVESSPDTIVVFPELSVTGYLMHDDVFDLAQPVPQGLYCQRLGNCKR